MADVEDKKEVWGNKCGMLVTNIDAKYTCVFLENQNNSDVLQRVYN